MKPIISEFISALDEEITTLKAGKGGNVTKVFDGKYIRKVPNGFIYLFHLENFLAKIDNAPAEIEIEKQKIPAEIISTQGLEAYIWIEEYCGENIAEAKLYTNLWFLLELLKRRFEASESMEDRFKISDALFSGDSSSFPVAENNKTLHFSPSEHRPDESQEKAIKNSFYNPLSIIWGPPGTGKTTTIAKAIEAHLNAGRKVLLVSHANNAVDQALLDIAKQMKNTSFYNDGELVRLGIPTEPGILSEFEKDYEMVLMDKIAAKLGESLIKEKEQLLNDREKYQKELFEINKVYDLINSLQSLGKESQAIDKDIRQITDNLNQSYQKYNEFKHEQSRQKGKLQEAQSYNSLTRLLKGLKVFREMK